MRFLGVFSTGLALVLFFFMGPMSAHGASVSYGLNFPFLTQITEIPQTAGSTDLVFQVVTGTFASLYSTGRVTVDLTPGNSGTQAVNTVSRNILTPPAGSEPDPHGNSAEVDITQGVTTTVSIPKAQLSGSGTYTFLFCTYARTPIGWASFQCGYLGPYSGGGSSSSNINGVCGSTQNSCDKGTLTNPTSDGATALWSCLGTGTMSPAYCSLAIASAACGATHYTCNPGTASDTWSNGSTWYWKCGSANCSETMPVGKVIVTTNLDDIGWTLSHYPPIYSSPGVIAGYNNTSDGAGGDGNGNGIWLGPLGQWRIMFWATLMGSKDPYKNPFGIIALVPPPATSPQNITSAGQTIEFAQNFSYLYMKSVTIDDEEGGARIDLGDSATQHTITSVAEEYGIANSNMRQISYIFSYADHSEDRFYNAMKGDPDVALEWSMDGLSDFVWSYSLNNGYASNGSGISYGPSSTDNGVGKIACDGGGFAFKSAYWRPDTYNLVSCSTSVSGVAPGKVTRTVSYVVTFNAGVRFGKKTVVGTVREPGVSYYTRFFGNHTFLPPPRTLIVVKNGTGSGIFTMATDLDFDYSGTLCLPGNFNCFNGYDYSYRVLSSIGINCGNSPCLGMETVYSGRRLITAVPDASSTVVWTGCDWLQNNGKTCAIGLWASSFGNKTVTATFTSTLLPPSVDLLIAVPNPVLYDSASALAWVASGGATACYITGGIYTSAVVGEWYGTYVGGPIGSVSTGNLVADTSYTVNCRNDGWVWATNPKAVTVTVTNPSTLKICPNPCNFSGTSFNGRTLTGVPVTPLYACYGTGDCSAPDTNVSATWSALNSPNNAIKFRGVAGTSTVSSSVNIDSDYFGLFSAKEEIRLSYPSASDATMNIVVSCQEKACSELSAQTNAYCRGEYRDLVEDRCNHTVNCEGAKNCNYTFKETSP